MLLGYEFEKLTRVFIIAMCLPLSAQAEEEKGFWASLVPDRYISLISWKMGSLFCQLFGGKDTGKVVIEGYKNIVTGTGCNKNPPLATNNRGLGYF